MAGKQTVIDIIVLLAVVCVITIIWWHPVKTPNIEPIVSEIDSIETKIDSLSTSKDSIDVIISIISNEKKLNEKRYKEATNIIIDNTIAEDLLFFTDYINRNKSRLDSINNL